MRAWYVSLDSRDTVIAHNGGKYDAIYLVHALAPLGEISAGLAGSAISSLRVKGGAEVIDTARVAPMSLEKFALAFGQIEKQALGLPCRCGQDCGGYCRLRVQGMTRAETEEAFGYCENDCRVNLSAYEGLLEYARAWDLGAFDRHGKPRRTIGGWAFSRVRELCGGVAWDEALPWGDYHADRACYHGGRSEVIRWKAESGERYDIRSAYPWAMTGAFPVGPSKTLAGRAAVRAYLAGRAGYYKARVRVPEGLPLLPMRGRLGLVWATGVIEGQYTGIELRAAERAGATILAVARATVWPLETDLLAPFVETYWPVRERELREKKRCEAAGDAKGAGAAKARADEIKLFCNSVSGKLAQRAGGACRIAIHPPEDAIGEEWIPLDGTEGVAPTVWAVPSRRVPHCARPMLAATITSRTHAERLLPRLARAGASAVYCDTDSCYQTRADERGVGDALGDFVREGSFRRWLAMAPKMYAYQDERGEWHTRAKGIPEVDRETIAALDRGETIERARGVVPFRSALAASARDGGSVFRRRSLKRKISRPRELCGRRWRLPDGGTVALHREGGRYRWPGIDADPHAYFRDL